jgi:hypothetical protein
VYGTPVILSSIPSHEAATLCSRHETRNARLVEAEKRRKLEHPRFTVAQDAEQADLNEGQFVPIGDLGEDLLDLEGKLNEGIDHTEVLLCAFRLGRRSRLGRHGVSSALLTLVLADVM